MNNLVPLPYSRIAVQHVETDLDEAAIRTFLHDKEAWFETDYYRVPSWARLRSRQDRKDDSDELVLSDHRCRGPLAAGPHALDR